jgi:hypothetical protein
MYDGVVWWSLVAFISLIWSASVTRRWGIESLSILGIVRLERIRRYAVDCVVYSGLGTLVYYSP